DVPEVLAVRVERKRGVTRHLDPVEIVAVEVRPTADVARHDANGRPDQRAAAQADGRDDVEAELELRLRRDRERQGFRIGVRTGVGDERKRGTAQPGDLELRLEVTAVRRERADDRERESEIARSFPVRLPAEG